MALMMEISVWLQAANIILVAVLILIYSRNLMKIKSNFTIGLLIFASFLLIQNLVGMYLGIVSMGTATIPFANYAFAINITETIALIALFWISWK